MMEKSSSFISLSGLSGVFAGLVALIGAFVAHHLLTCHGIEYFSATGRVYTEDIVKKLFLIALTVLLLSLFFGIYFTVRKSKKHGLKIWNKVTRNLLLNLSIPLIAGGMFCLALISYRIHGFIAPSMLIFYGLALVNASKYTYGDIRWLGYFEIIIGVIASFLIGYGLVFWALGFGILHIIYGVLMYKKYDLN